MSPEFGPSFPVCKDCGFAHPPVSGGSKCPMAKEKTSAGKEIDFTNFFNNLKNMLSTKITEKKIEKPEKLFSKILLEIFKVADNYKEE